MNPRPAEPAAERHGLALSVALHLAPGLAIGAAYHALRAFARAEGLPPVFALAAAFALVGAPLLLGILIVAARRRHARASLEGVVVLREALTPRRLLVLGPSLLAWGIACLALVGPVALDAASDVSPGGLPAFHGLDLAPPALPRAELVALLLVLLSNDLVAPAAEELYFRGWLLPRMAALGAAAPLANAALFALYAVWTPELFAARFLAVAPLVFAVWRTRCLALGIAVRGAGNVLATLSVWGPALAAGPPG